MRIEMIRNTVVDGQARQIGDVVETDEATAGYLIAIRKAVPHQAREVEQATVTAPEQAVTRKRRKP